MKRISKAKRTHLMAVVQGRLCKCGRGRGIWFEPTAECWPCHKRRVVIEVVGAMRDARLSARREGDD